MRFIVIGLGNIGDKYRGTLHNVGFSVLDTISQQISTQFKDINNYSFLEYESENELVLIKPKTYMNNSGEVIPFIKKKYMNDKSTLMIVADNMDLPIGKIKIKQNNGSAGQNGLKSIFHYYSGDYFTLFVGIGHPVIRDDVADYVLSKPFGDDKQKLSIAIENSSKLILDMQKSGNIESIRASLNLYNN